MFVISVNDFLELDKVRSFVSVCVYQLQFHQRLSVCVSVCLSVSVLP